MAEAARHDEDVGVRHLGEGTVGDEPEGLLLGSLHARAVSDEEHLRAGDLSQHVVGADGVERRHAVVEQDRDPHGMTPFGREYATPAIWLLGR